MDVPCVTTVWNSDLFDSTRRGGEPPPRCKCFNLHFALGPGPGRPLGPRTRAFDLRFVTCHFWAQVTSCNSYFCNLLLRLQWWRGGVLHAACGRFGGEWPACPRPVGHLERHGASTSPSASGTPSTVRTTVSRRPRASTSFSACGSPRTSLTPFGWPY